MSQIQKILQTAEELGIKDNLFFVATLSDYKQIRDNMKKVGRELEKQGVMKNERANPLLSEFNSCAMTSANIAEKLMKMLGMQVEKKKTEREAGNDGSKNTGAVRRTAGNDHRIHETEGPGTERNAGT